MTTQQMINETKELTARLDKLVKELNLKIGA